MAAFVSGYLAPGVYDRTLIDPNVASLLGGLRIPVIIGTGQEDKLLLNADLVRGSSASVDNKSPDEDVSAQADGSNVDFQVLYYPIVTGEGSGIIATRPSDVVAKVNNIPVPVSRVDGENGTVRLQIPPAASDTVTITYYFKLTDTLVTDEDISVQADGTNVRFFTANKPIVDGRGSGIPTTTLTDITVKVDGLVVLVSEVDGINGWFDLVAAPGGSTTVTVTYYYNQHANTFDLLPEPGLTTMIGAGDSPELNNYIEGTDYIIIDGSKIQWGAGVHITVDTHTTGSVYFDDTQISTVLIDDRILLEDVSSQFTGTETVITTRFAPIVDGNGRDIVTNDPTKVKAYVNSVEVDVTRVDGAAGNIYLAAAPGGGDTVEVSYYRNQIEDEVYTLTITTAGVTGVGDYTIDSASQGPLALAEETAVSSAVTPVYATPIKPHKNISVAEVVTLTFTSPTAFGVTSTNPAGSGSGTTTTGITGRTFIDDVTGLQFTIEPDAGYLATDTIDITVTKPGTFVTATTAVYSIPGVQLIVNNTENTGVGDTTLLQTYDKAGEEPAVGSTYYVTYRYAKTDFTPKVFTRFKDISAEYGELAVDNQITLSAFLMMTNGAVAVMCMQILKETGQNTATDQSFLDAFQVLLRPVDGIKPRVIHPVSTSSTVISGLKTHVAQASAERNRSERVAWYGFPVGTETSAARQSAAAVGFSRMTAVYPDGAIIGITDEQGTENEYIVDGSYLAAAIVGVAVSTTYDVAEPLTRKTITGFKRLIRTLDEIEMDDVASGGVTVIFDDSGILKIRHSLSTDMSNAFTKAPNIQGIIDEVQIQARLALDQYIGRKFLPNTISDVIGTLAATLSALKEAEIINDFTGVDAEQSDFDPNYMVAEAYYKPVFELSYIRVTFNIRATL